MRFTVALLSVIFLGATAVAADRGFRFTAADNALPTMKSIIVVKSGEPGPRDPKHHALGEVGKYKELLKTAEQGPFDIYWQGKNGIAIRAASGVKLGVDEVKEIKLPDLVGVVNFRGDNQPRVSLITIAAQDDPGPDEKGHKAVQTATEFRKDMVVPEGNYSLWITPENGARPRRVIDRFRVQAGKSVQLD